MYSGNFWHMWHHAHICASCPMVADLPPSQEKSGTQTSVDTKVSFSRLQSPVSFAWEGRQTGTQHRWQGFIRQLWTGVLQHLWQLVHGQIGDAWQIWQQIKTFQLAQMDANRKSQKGRKDWHLKPQFSKFASMTQVNRFETCVNHPWIIRGKPFREDFKRFTEHSKHLPRCDPPADPVGALPPLEGSCRSCSSAPGNICPPSPAWRTPTPCGTPWRDTSTNTTIRYDYDIINYQHYINPISTYVPGRCMICMFAFKVFNVIALKTILLKITFVLFDPGNWVGSMAYITTWRQLRRVKERSMACSQALPGFVKIFDMCETTWSKRQVYRGFHIQKAENMSHSLKCMYSPDYTRFHKYFPRMQRMQCSS